MLCSLRVCCSSRFLSRRTATSILASNTYGQANQKNKHHEWQHVAALRSGLAKTAVLIDILTESPDGSAVFLSRLCQGYRIHLGSLPLTLTRLCQESSSNGLAHKQQAHAPSVRVRLFREQCKSTSGNCGNRSSQGFPKHNQKANAHQSSTCQDQ